MPSEKTATAHRQVRTLFEVGAVGTMTDGQLLELFTARRNDDIAEFAFEALVKRHGPMVMGVCRRILRDSHDSADAFQATFLVLARRAGGVRVDDSLGRWLYGVSRRVALQARASAARRLSREVAGAEPAEIANLDSACHRQRDRDQEDLFAALDEEVARLPEKYRAAVMLCDLEGTKHDEAARRLGCPVGTIESRLSRGRELLRARLWLQLAGWRAGDVGLGVGSSRRARRRRPCLPRWWHRRPASPGNSRPGWHRRPARPRRP